MAFSDTEGNIFKELDGDCAIIISETTASNMEMEEPCLKGKATVMDGMEDIIGEYSAH